MRPFGPSLLGWIVVGWLRWAGVSFRAAFGLDFLGGELFRGWRLGYLAMMPI